MAVYEALLLNTVVPQIQAAQTGDSYVMVVNATTPALRITQTGTGNALVVEDEANPDSSPFVVTAAGDVGAGISSPNARLAVVGGGIRVSGYTNNLAGDGYNVQTGVTGNVGYIQSLNGTSTNALSIDANTIQFRTGSFAFAALFDASGNLGIGAPTPAYKLEVNGGASDAMSLFNSTNANGAHLRFAASGTVKSFIGGAPGFLGSGTADDLGIRAVGSVLFATNGSSVDMTLDSSGNLGLGVTPSAWNSSYKAQQINARAVVAGDSTQTVLANNWFTNSSGTNIYIASAAATAFSQDAGVFKWFNAASGTANTATITNGVSYTIITSGNQTAFGAANNNVGTLFTATSSGTLSSGTVSQNISFTQAMTLDASGNLIIGDTSGASTLNLVRGGSDSTEIKLKQTGTGGRDYRILSSGSGYGSAGNLIFYDVTASAERVRIDSSGNLTIGNSKNLYFNDSGTGIYGEAGGSGLISFKTNGSERARITSGGYFKASNSGAYDGVSSAYHELYQSADNRAVIIANVNASATTDGVVFVRADRNTTSNTFYALSYYNAGAAAYKFRVADSGDVTNTNGTYGTISDQKMKTDIVDAGSQWSDIKALRFRKFKMKDDPDQRVQLGVVAQEVELTSPGLVDEHQDRDGEGNDLGTTTKSVKTSVLLMKAAVALQEAMARIETLEAEVAALKGA
jgi:hypothetical protein